MFGLCSHGRVGANRRIKALGQFAWADADLGVACRSCGRVRVFCDFEAERSFRERGWSTHVDDAAKRLRCPCGSGEVALIPVPISKRPKPLPVRPAPLRPIYVEDGRQLRRRGPPAVPDRHVHDRALDLLGRAVASFPEHDPAGLKEAAAALRPHVYHADYLDALLAALAAGPQPLVKRQSVDLAWGHIQRQLGHPRA